MKRIYLNLSVCALALVALCACGESHPQNNSNTNWLRECNAAADCNGDEQCACGVCTIACTSDDTCQTERAPDAACASLAELACSGSDIGAVCTASCSRDSECGDGALSCVEGSCVETKSAPHQPERDAAVDGAAEVGDAEVGDAEVKDDGAVPPSLARGAAGGPCFRNLTCDDGLTCVDAVCTVIPPSCEERLGCDASSACLNGHCQRLWSGDGCEPAPETRPVCSANTDCDPGTVCHVDGTCIEPGQCDRFGLTTLASVGDVVAMTVTKDSVFVLDKGSEDGLGNHQSDGAIQRVALADGSTQTVVGDLYRPLDLKVDASRVYWRYGASGEIGLGWADRTDGGNRGDLPLDGDAVDIEWLLDREHIYVLIVKERDLAYLFRVSKGTTALEDLMSEEGLRFSYGMGLDRDYVYFNGGQRWSLADSMVLEPTPVSSFVADPSFIDYEHIFYVSGGNAATWSVGYIGKDDGRQTTLAEFANEADTNIYWVKAYRGELYFLYGRPLGDRRTPMDSVVRRAPVTPGEPKLVAYLTAGSHLTDVSDQGLFSIQGQRLVRQVIEDYASGPSPAQGASGAPCFGDQTCDAGLSCLDALCE
jgi:hypothetical protein